MSKREYPSKPHDIATEISDRVKIQSVTMPTASTPRTVRPQEVNLYTLGACQSSYYLPGRVDSSSIPCLFLLDTGCSLNVLSSKIFDVLPESIKSTLQTTTTVGMLADGTTLPFIGEISVSGKVRTVPVTIQFTVAPIDKDAILGMPFFVDNDCTFLFKQSEFTIGGVTLRCVDNQGKPLTRPLQLVQSISIPPRSEINTLCRVAVDGCPTMGIVAGIGTVLVASTVNVPRNSRLLVRCMNPGYEELCLTAGTKIATFTQLSEDEVFDCNQSDIPAHLANIDQVEVQREQAVPNHLEELYASATPNCRNAEERATLSSLLVRYSDVFSTDASDVGRTDLVQHTIPLIPGMRPIRQPPRRLGHEKEVEVESQISKLLKQGLIEPASGAWSSPVVLVKKKDGSWRFCIDYRRLNDITQQDAYPLPRIDESLDALAGARYFTTLDLTSGYWQVPLDVDAQEKSAFCTRGGLWKWKVLPFGLTSAPATFQRMMKGVFQGLHWKTLLLYLDDVIVLGNEFNSHCQRL